LQAVWAQQALSEQPSAGALAGAAEEGDDWVELTALPAVHELEPDRPGVLDRMRESARGHSGQPVFHRPVASAAACLLAEGAEEGPELAESALQSGGLDFRMEFTRQLMAAAQQDEGAALLEDHLTSADFSGVPALCMALALRGAGGSLEALSPPVAGEFEEGSEQWCAGLALGAMDNEPEAARALEHALREGEPRLRYAAAHYLALARVRSAVVVFSSVRDQVEAPYVLRALCAASLVRRGHPAALTELNNVLRSVKGRQKADLLFHLCRAVEDIIPLMLQCRDVNVGRFV
jgi:hypothetical protein